MENREEFRMVGGGLRKAAFPRHARLTRYSPAILTIGLMLFLNLAQAGVPARTKEGFRIAEPNYPFSFPHDHGSHPEFKIEWWYLTGHLRADGPSSQSFGVQATFFRFGLNPGPGKSTQKSPDPVLFGQDQLYLSHMALLHVETGRFIYEERFQRENWDAAAAVGKLDVRNGNWQLEGEGETDFGPAILLRGSVLSETRFQLRLVPEKPLVLFGKDGVSRKGAHPSAASLYITFPRLAAKGELQWAGEEYQVTGQAWMDHEISSSQLDENQAGWDWASLQLDDGREIMLYLMRDQDGAHDAFSRLYWISPSGRLHETGPEEFQWKARSSWRSPHTDTVYPAHFTLRTVDPASGEQVQFDIRPLAADQEISGKLGGVAYWEGASVVLNAAGEVVGRGYVELAGYDGKLRERLR